MTARNVLPIRRKAGLLAVLLLVCAGCGGRTVDGFEMQDLPAPAMFLNLAGGLKAPHVIELFSRPPDPRFDLKLGRTTEGEILDAIVKLDPLWQGASRRGVLVMWPKSADALEASPYSKRVSDVDLTAPAHEVVAALAKSAGANLEVVGDKTLSVQRITLRAHDETLRDALVDVARLAHAGLVLEPSRIHLQRPERPEE